MKVIEKDWKYGKYLVYDEVEEIFIPTEKGMRVLPAPFFYDKKLYFELKAVYAPGDKRTFPNGGYEVVDVSGGIRSYDLDQVIIHPQVLHHKKMLDKMARRAEKQAKKRERNMKKIGKENKPTTGRRGRPALDPAEKALRDTAKAESKVRSGGKRGRPANPNKVVVVKPASTGGRRGRPALSADQKAAREAAKAAQTKRSGGKRGRPKRAK
jgi:hypothetical protein